MAGGSSYQWVESKAPARENNYQLTFAIDCQERLYHCKQQQILKQTTDPSTAKCSKAYPGSSSKYAGVSLPGSQLPALQTVLVPLLTKVLLEVARTDGLTVKRAAKAVDIVKAAMVPHLTKETSDSNRLSPWLVLV